MCGDGETGEGSNISNPAIRYLEGPMGGEDISSIKNSE